jgi:N-acetyl-anhydromuramyl-L-alanine amidase AmpD
VKRGTFVPCARACLRARNRPVDRLVLHRMEGTLPGTIAWFQREDRREPTAAHFLVGLDGRIVQMALMNLRVPHCGSRTVPGWNDRAIGIELEGFVRDPYPDIQVDTVAALVASEILRLYPAITPDRVHIVGHSEIPGVDHTDPGPLFPWDRFLAQVGRFSTPSHAR